MHTLTRTDYMPPASSIKLFHLVHHCAKILSCKQHKKIFSMGSHHMSNNVNINGATNRTSIKCHKIYTEKA